MHVKKYGPILVSVLLVIFGSIYALSLFNHWKSQEISINKPSINFVKTDSQTLDLKTIIHEAEKNVVQIEAQNENSTLTGSGFLYNEKGDIITNAHVVKDADVIYVRTSNARFYPAAIVGVSDDTDVAVLRVPQLASQTGMSIEDHTKAEIGDEVIALGSPHGFQNTVTLGIISGTERNFSVDGFDYDNVYQISAQITHGNSGGPLIERTTGKIIGINSVGTGDGTLGFSIPIIEVIDQVETWSNNVQTEQLDFSNTTDIISKVDPEKITKDATYLINYFLESILIRDYVGAYTLLGSSMQMQMSYADFREKYVPMVDLDYSDLSTKVTEDNHNKTTINISIETRVQNQQKTVKDTYQYVFTTGYENDQLKIQQISQK